ncbi:GNAT family N-acetyltransferase [Alteromonas sp. CYL-A6]|uniref:GNAT family N-acetyltransferase n=1 Tax=Alteromonas nitratireducens TaxID=3390813 RepID=UPI0034C09A99
MDYQLVRATQEDAEFLLALRLQTMNEHLEAAGLYLTAAEHKARVAHQYEHSYLIYFDGVCVGLLKYEDQPASVYVMQFQLLPAHQGKGYGRAILADVIKRAGEKPVRLTVLKQNPAKRLYYSMGFELVGEDEHEYHLQLTP